jgi:hypothetical protein
VNKKFISKDPMSKWWPLYSNNVDIRKITTGQPMRLCRVHTDPNAAGGRFLAREKAIRPLLNNPEALRKYLGLPDVPIYITDVNIPVGTEIYVGRIGPQPAFGLRENSGFQYQTLVRLPKKYFVNTRRIQEPSTTNSCR